MNALETFARRVLEILENEPEWSSNTATHIAEEAFELKLAELGDEQQFVRVRPAPCTPSR